MILETEMREVKDNSKKMKSKQEETTRSNDQLDL